MKYIVDIKGEIEGDYEIIGKYEEMQKGEWIFHKDNNESCRYGCNRCGNLNNIPSNFCPNCGAKMVKKFGFLIQI